MTTKKRETKRKVRRTKEEDEKQEEKIYLAYVQTYGGLGESNSL